MPGLHLLGDARASRNLSNREGIQNWMTVAVKMAGLSLLGFQAWDLPSHLDSGPGVSLTAVLVESHACLETWPEHNTICICFYSCKLWKPEPIVAYFEHYFGVMEWLTKQLIPRFGPEGAQ